MMSSSVFVVELVNNNRFENNFYFIIIFCPQSPKTKNPHLRVPIYHLSYNSFIFRFDSTKRKINDPNVRLEFYDSDDIKVGKKIVSSFSVLILCLGPVILPIVTELKNMEWNYLVSPSQADGKNCVHDVPFLTFI